MIGFSELVALALTWPLLHVLWTLLIGAGAGIVCAVQGLFR